MIVVVVVVVVVVAFVFLFNGMDCRRISPAPKAVV
jgi:hypothetical protein